MRTKFDKDSLAVEQSNQLDKILNGYIVYDIDGWKRNPTNNFKFKIPLFGANSIVKHNSDKEKYVHSGYRITFDSACSWNFDNDTAKNIIVFGIDNSSSSHANNLKNNFLKREEDPNFGINGSFG